MSEQVNRKPTEKARPKEEENDWRYKINWEKFYKTMVIIVTALVPFFLYDMLKFRGYCERNGLRYQSAWVTVYSLIIAGFLAIYRNVICRKLFYNFFLQNIDKKIKGDDRLARATKAVKWAGDILYYLSATAYSIIYFRHKKWFPLVLDKDWYDQEVMVQWPNKIQDDVSVYMDYYIVVQFGQHIYAFLEILSRRKTDPKFYEWTLHHILALTLIFYSTYNNFMVPAVVQLVLHDVADIFVSSFKIYGVFRTDIMLYVKAACMIISWFITRIFIYPKGVLLPLVDYFSQIYNVEEEQEYHVYTKASYIYMEVLSFLLYGMHIYWFATMLTMLFQHIKKIFVTTKPVKFQDDHAFHSNKSKQQ